MGTQILRSPLVFPAAIGGFTSDWGWGAGGGRERGGEEERLRRGGGAYGGYRCGSSSSVLAGVVSRSLIAPLWAHDLSGEGGRAEGRSYNTFI